MAIEPIRREQIKSGDRLNWSQVFRPEFGDLVSLGFVDGARPMSFGSTISGLASTDGNVAFREGTPLAFGTDLSASTVYICSSSGSDTQEFSVQGLDANDDFQTVDVTATGTTPAAVPGTWNHVQRFIAKTTPNVGTVYISTDAGALPTTAGDQIQCVMLPADSYGINPLLKMGNNMYGLIHRFDFSTDTRNACLIRVKANRQGNWLLNFKFYASDADYHQDFLVPLRLYPGDAIRVEIQLTSGTGASATYGMNGMVFELSPDTPYAGVSQLWSNA